MTEYAIVPATLEHAAEVAANMGDADKQEIWASGHSAPIEATTHGVRVSRDARAFLADGRCFAVFGIGDTTLLSAVACPWLLGTHELPRHARPFLRASKEYISEWKRQHKLLVNYADVRHTAAIRWLGWLGFTFDAPAPYGKEGLPFMRFWMEGEG